MKRRTWAPRRVTLRHAARGPKSESGSSLREIEPEIWRRVLVPRGVGLDRLHEIFQVAMGWTISHLHEFRVGDTRYGEPDPEYDEGDVREERSVRLFEVAPGVNDSFLYEYDFGDSWEHLVVVEKVLTSEEGPADLPVCKSARIVGEGRCRLNRGSAENEAGMGGLAW